MQAFEEAAHIVRPDLKLIAIYAIASVWFIGGFWTFVSLIGVVVAFILNVVISGRIAFRVSAREIPSASVIFLAFYLKVLVVTLVLSLPSVIVAMVLMGVSPSPAQRFAIEFVVTVCTSIMLMFALPIVYLKRVGLVAIPAAFIMLRNSWRSSQWIITLILLTILIPQGLLFLIPLTLFPLYLLVGVVTSVIGAYFLYIAFAGATAVVLSSSVGGAGAT